MQQEDEGKGRRVQFSQAKDSARPRGRSVTERLRFSACLLDDCWACEKTSSLLAEAGANPPPPLREQAGWHMHWCEAGGPARWH